jgi:hypothetical protein
MGKYKTTVYVISVCEILEKMSKNLMSEGTTLSMKL